MDYLFFDTTYNAMIGKNTISVGRLSKPAKFSVVGSVKGYVTSVGNPISDDGVRWVQRLALDFDEAEIIWVQADDADSPETTTLTAEPE